MKELYTKPELELKKFNDVDVLTASKDDDSGVDIVEGGEL